MAGVPAIAQSMFESVKHTGVAGGRTMLSRTVTCDLPEGIIAQRLGEIQAAHPDLDIGSYPFWTATGFGTSLVLRGPDPDELAMATDEVSAMVTALRRPPVGAGGGVTGGALFQPSRRDATARTGARTWWNR